MTGWNLPPGCTGSEPQIAGISAEDEAICNACPFLDENGDCDPNRPDCPLNFRGWPCPKCGKPMETDHNSAQCHDCECLWPLSYLTAD